MLLECIIYTFGESVKKKDEDIFSHVKINSTFTIN